MANIPQACGSAARAMAAYRFFDNTKVTMDALLEPHRKATIDRMRREPVALVAQDSSSLNYTLEPNSTLSPHTDDRDALRNGATFTGLAERSARLAG
jgi:hypothetical protein